MTGKAAGFGKLEDSNHRDCSAPCIELYIDVFQMAADSVNAQTEVGGDSLGGTATAQKSADLQLSRREALCSDGDEGVVIERHAAVSRIGEDVEPGRRT